MRSSVHTASELDNTQGNTAIATYTGRAFDVLAPDTWDFSIIDIAQALSSTNRFGGHVYSYSVADHSLRVAERASAEGHDERMQLACLMHDAAEAYLGDVPSPIKKLMSIGEYSFAEVEDQVMIELLRQLCGWDFVMYFDDNKETVKRYDWDQYLWERDHRPFIPYTLSPMAAYDDFMRQWDLLRTEL